MKRGIHITEERELRFVQHRLANFPEAMKAVVQDLMLCGIPSPKLVHVKWNPGLGLFA
jgi:hypothetical protein